jgi:adenosylhomocysteine nucleosidase
MLVLICFALKEEAALFRKMAADKPGVAIIVTGVGRKNAEKSLREFLATHSPELVLTCGFAGGLNPDLKLGEVVFEMPNWTDELHKSPPGFEVRDLQSSSLREKMIAAGAKPVKFLCAEKIATTVAEKKKLRDETGADAVEMESEVIHAVCRERGIPCATVRVISDTANEDLPLDFNQLSKPDSSLDYGKLALTVLKAPAKIVALLRLQRQCRFAAGQLAGVLAKIILKP